jgi:hypothetical protein
MLKVKVVGGLAVSIEQLDVQGWFTSFLNRYFMDEFIIIDYDNAETPIIEGEIYSAWSIGKGRIVLLQILSE